MNDKNNKFIYAIVTVITVANLLEFIQNTLNNEYDFFNILNTVLGLICVGLFFVAWRKDKKN